MRKLIYAGVLMLISHQSTFAQWNLNGIHVYNANIGNVGIGVNSPSSKLHLKKSLNISEASMNPINDLMTLTFATPDGFVPPGTISRMNFKFQDWSNGETSFGAIGVEKESDINGIYGGGKMNFYTYAPARGAGQPSPGLVKAFSIDRFGNTSIMATINYSYIPSSNTILKLQLHTPDVFVPYGTENKISFSTKSFNNSEDEIAVISVKVGDEAPSSYGGGEILFYTKDSSPGGGAPGNGLLERMRIDNNGNLGLGTSNPSQKLTVKGTVYSTEVKVDVNAGTVPDYVFEPTYNLPTLAETEAYIKANKHLPEVPSAKEMEANGINLSEMNMLLLKKVEELTLHLIKATKKIESQQKHIDALDKKVYGKK